MLMALSIALADGSNDTGQTLALAWTHYNMVGHLDTRLALDFETAVPRHLQVGHYFDFGRFRIDLFGHRVEDDLRLAFGVAKDFKLFSIGFKHTPDFSKTTYSLHGPLLGAKSDIGLAYTPEMDRVNLTGRYRVARQVSFYGKAAYHQDEWNAQTGLSISFTTGERRRPQPKPKKIIWQD